MGCFAIYDGHGGRKSVQHVHKHLFNAILEEPAFAQGDVAAAISAAYHKVDAAFTASYSKVSQ